MKLKKVHSMLLVPVIACSLMTTPVLAAPDSSTSQSTLESQKATAQSEVSSLQTQLNSLMSKMNELETQLITKGQEITQAQADLEAAQAKEAQQYEDLKLRIKYMYEEGDGTAMEKVLSSGSIAELLTQAEYVQQVHQYDRDQLDAYTETVQEVTDLKATLESDMNTLQSLESEYESQSAELSSTIESKSAEISNLDAMIQEAARVALEAAAKKQAEEAAAQAAAQQAAASTTSGTTTSGTTASTGTTSGTTTETVQNTTPVVENTYVEETTNNTYVEETTPEPSYNVSTGNAIVDRAYSWVGNAEYVWGGCSPGAFDCSGFVSYCLTGSYSRLGTTYTFLAWPQVSDPQPGDVCVNANHTGIYIGGGQMIHAATFGVGVIVGPVQSGMIYVRY